MEGCRKTYRAIKEASKLWTFTIAVPTRQLAYEIIIDYPEVDWVYTGEISIDGTNKVVTYEELQFGNFISNINTLIIDEAHFLNDADRWPLLLRNIVDAVNKYKVKNIIFLTATNSLDPQLLEKLNCEIIELKPFKTIERKIFRDDYLFKQVLKQENIKSMLVFTKYKPTKEDINYYLSKYGDLLGIDKYSDEDIAQKTGLIHADIPTSERIKTQLKFRNGELKLVISSNVLAQWVNFPAEAVVIEYNEWDTPEIIHQKIWRAGRPFLSDKAYILLREIPVIQKKEIKKKKNITKKFFYKNIFIWDQDFEWFEIPSWNEYSQFKYSKRFLERLKNKGLLDTKDKMKLDYLVNEEEKLKNIIQKYKRLEK